MNDVASRVPQNVPSAWETYRRLLGYLRPHKLQFALGLSGALVYAVSMASFPQAAKYFGDSVFTHPDPRAIVWLPVGMVLIFVLRGLGDFTQTYFMGYVGRQIVKRLRGELFHSTVRLPVSVFDRSNSATMLSQLTYNTEQIGAAATDAVVVMVRSALTIVAFVSQLFILNWKLALISLTMGPAVGWLVTLINRKFRRYGRRIQDSMGGVTRIAKESFEAPRLLKVYNAESHVDSQFEAVNEHNRRSNMRLILTKGLSNPIVQLLTAIGAAFVLAIAVAALIQGRMSKGDLIGFFTALASLTQPLKDLIGAAMPMQQGIAAAQGIFAIMDAPGESRGGGHLAGRVRGDVQFDNVSFTYDTGKGEALRGISFQVAAGQSIAIVGRTGSGKSTLVNLLPRFYDVKAGRLLIDRVDVREYELHNLRDQIAVVSQDVVLFNDTIRNNIAFGRDFPPAAIEAAAEAAHVLEFTRELQAGLDTVVGDRGVLLSGGQRQRITIARALLKNAPILILDEATSALDTEAERHIQAALAQLVRNRTTFVIAHRLSTVEQADRIIVLDSGSIVESGTHAELLAHAGVYSQLHHLQFND
ncbi:MAG: lipid A export permease/ATP-binding protein MsbA [Sinobacteraceae bacterium]|nr:lipid A export permease/ATP-binding protein MsbA [Nevskiaceae bacterium]